MSEPFPPEDLLPAPSPEAVAALRLVEALQTELRHTRETLTALVLKVAATVGSVAGLALGVAGTLAAICL